jgi:hypothetical protein
MEKISQNKKKSVLLEVSEGELQTALKESAQNILPSEMLLRATLKKIVMPISESIGRPILSPFTHISFAHQSFWKVGVSVAAIVLIVGGGTLAAYNPSFFSTTPIVDQSSHDATLTMSNPTDTSDAAITQDSNVIDSELDSLDSNVAATDQSLNYESAYSQ